MRNFFLFIQRYSHVFLFLILESIAFYSIYSFNYYHHAVLLNTSNNVNGYILTKRANFTKYFTLGEENIRLQNENNELRKKILESYYISKSDTIRNNDSSFRQRFNYIVGTVIQNSTDLQNNYITIDKGSNHGILKNDGVICPQGIVGIVVNVSDNFCIAMSLLNSKCHIPPKLKNNNSPGKLVWKGESPYYINLEKVNRFTPIKKGDLVQSSLYSTIFPENVMIGKVEKIQNAANGSYLNVKVKLSTNFTNIRSVYIIKNLQKAELQYLEEQTTIGN